MAPCFRCRLRKLTCSEETFCKQCKLAGFKCKYQMHRSKSTFQYQRQTKSAPFADTLSSLSYEDELSDTETIDSHDQCVPPTLQYLGDNLIYTSIERPVEQKQIPGASNPSPRLVLSNPNVGDGVVFEFSINGQMVEYLYEPTDQQFPSPTSSNTTWQFIIGAKLCELLINLPLGSPAISTIGAPFFDNQYAGDELGFLEVSWQKSFLVARKIGQQQRGEPAGMRTFLRKHIEGLVAGRREEVPKAQELRQSTTSNSLLLDPALKTLRNSPLPQPRQINLKPSPSPPPMVPLPDTRSDRSSPLMPSHGDAVLVSFIDNGRVTDMSRQAGEEVLASEAEGDLLQRTIRNRFLKEEPRKELRKESREDFRKQLRKQWRKQLRKQWRKQLRKELKKELKKVSQGLKKLRL